MKSKKEKTTPLIKVENLINYNQNLDPYDQTFNKIMFLYQAALQELENKLKIIQEEFKVFYQYELIDHINTRIKTPESIQNKMKKRNLEPTYQNMIENINDIAGIRIICPLKKDIYSIKNIIQEMPNTNILKEKDYVANPKKSGYQSYHLIAEVPITLSQKSAYVKTEIQIRTIAMDFWATLEHKGKYKTTEKITAKESKEWINCAKLISKLDNKMMLLDNN